MSKFDDYLTEIVYEIDDLIYDFYKQSNDMIALKQNQEKLIDFRDKTITTLNDMNVRSLEVISQFKNREMVESRVEILVHKNQSILDSALSVIDSDLTRGSFVKDLYQNVVSGAKRVVDVTSDPENIEKIKTTAQKGYEKVKDTLQNVSDDPRFQNGVKRAKDVAVDAISIGNDALRSSSLKLKDWLDSRQERNKAESPESTELHEEGDEES